MSNIPPKGNYLNELVLHLRLWWRLLQDPRVPTVLKLAVPALVLAYLLWPADALLDLIPVLGQADDVLVLMLGLRLFESWAPRPVVMEHLAHLRHSPMGPRPAEDGEVIDGEYRIL